jgi:hypothetical protein
MKRRSITPAIKVSGEEFNQALSKYNQQTIDFAQILLPGETMEEWMQEFKAANKGGYLLRYAKKAIQTNDYLLWYGSATQAVENQNTINIYDAMITGGQPKIVNPHAFLKALRKQRNGSKRYNDSFFLK